MDKIKKYIKYFIIGLFIFSIVFIFTIKNITLQINYKTNDIGKIQLYYDNGSDIGYPFNEECSSIKELNLINTKFDEVKFRLDIHQIKKIRIDFNDIENIEIKDIYISSLGFKLYKYSAEDIIKDFKILNDIEINTGDNLNIIIKGKDPFIGTEKINIQKIFILICLMTLIITSIIIIFIITLNNKGLFIIKKYKISNEDLLVFIFISMLILPNIVFYLPIDRLKSNTENRTLTQKPQLDLTQINKFTKEFEAYYNDNLPFKDILVKLNSQFKMNILNTSPQNYVIKGKDDWLFYNSKYRNDADTLSDYNGTNYYTEEQLELFKDKIQRMEEICNQNGSDFYLMIAPNKSQIYSKYMPEKYGPKSSNSKVDIIVDYLKENTDIKVIYPKKELLDLSDKHQLYYKLDTHWNKLGAYVAYSQLINQINSTKNLSLTDLKILEQERIGGDLASMIGLNKELNEREFIIENINKYKIDLIEESGTELYRYTSQNKNGKKILCFRDSFFTEVIPYLSQDFEESLYLWQKNFDEELIKKEKPNIVIMESVERLIDQIN